MYITYGGKTLVDAPYLSIVVVPNVADASHSLLEGEGLREATAGEIGYMILLLLLLYGRLTWFVLIKNTSNDILRCKLFLSFSLAVSN